MQPAPRPPRQRGEDRRTTQAALSLGYNLAGGFLLLGGGGHLLDRIFGSGYAWTLAGVSLAFLYGGYEVWKLVQALDRNDRRDPGEGGA